MAARSPQEAVKVYVQSIQTTVSCVTKAVLSLGAGSYSRLDHDHFLGLNWGDPLPLSGRAGVSLSLLQDYRILKDEGTSEPYRVTTTKYEYALVDTASHQEILAYHWHPEGDSWEDRPHLHIIVRKMTNEELERND